MIFTFDKYPWENYERIYSVQARDWELSPKYFYKECFSFKYSMKIYMPLYIESEYTIMNERITLFDENISRILFRKKAHSLLLVAR